MYSVCVERDQSMLELVDSFQCILSVLLSTEVLHQIFYNLQSLIKGASNSMILEQNNLSFLQN